MDKVKTKNIGFFGATFDPIHKGHIEIASKAKKILDLDEVWFVPNKNPYYKKQPKASNSHRLEMIKLAIKHEKKFKLYEEEIKSLKYTYTIDSLRRIKNIHHNIKLNLIMGVDSFQSIQSWKDYKEITNYADIIVFPRKESQHTELSKNELKSTKKSKIRFVEQEKIIEASSSKIRDNSKFWSKYLTQEIINYIIKHKIYN